MPGFRPRQGLSLTSESCGGVAAIHQAGRSHHRFDTVPGPAARVEVHPSTTLRQESCANGRCRVLWQGRPSAATGQTSIRLIGFVIRSQEPEGITSAVDPPKAVVQVPPCRSVASCKTSSRQPCVIPRPGDRYFGYGHAAPEAQLRGCGSWRASSRSAGPSLRFGAGLKISYDPPASVDLEDGTRRRAVGGAGHDVTNDCLRCVVLAG